MFSLDGAIGFTALFPLRRRRDGAGTKNTVKMASVKATFKVKWWTNQNEAHRSVSL